ncbi:hypothetical protein AKJ51_01585 [candidate division MSBL1 archaeon SCGC-AAA382A20]|uniref:LamG-like jellyroll fold domain-containing protein n=1 Tax=candidate division MSBL1 archaeon SCGC-AAA382A20 TaxID=1698280 RepID=A0A133VLP3_9EURY|nr:hypothetical protein AKJ51_01585 [candidate division MSBL1 archaeon SCGC-AAA382A20]
MNYKRIRIILSIIFVVFFISIPLSSAERYKQIEITLNYSNENPNLKEEINISNRSSEDYSNYNLTWQPFTLPHKSNLVSEWHFDEEDKNVTAYDSVGLNNGDYPDDCNASANGVEGTGVEFTHNYPVEVNNFDFPPSQSEFTFSGWWKPSSPFYASNEYYIFQLSSNAYLKYNDADNFFEFGIEDDNGNWHRVGGSYLISSNDWYHILVTVQVGSIAKIYVNGIGQGYGTHGYNPTLTLETNYTFSSNTMEFGHFTYGDTIDEYSIYNAYFTTEDADNLLNSPKGSVSCALMPPTKLKTSSPSSPSDTQSAVQFATFSHKDTMEGSSIQNLTTSQ